jgi:hypothetical protein
MKTSPIQNCEVAAFRLFKSHPPPASNSCAPRREFRFKLLACVVGVAAVLAVLAFGLAVFAVVFSEFAAALAVFGVVFAVSAAVLSFGLAAELKEEGRIDG